jgi:membrane-associated phospholipid phosphatase
VYTGAVLFVTNFADQAVILPLVLAVTVALAAQGWRRGAVVWLGVVGATLAVVLLLKLVCLACAPVDGLAELRSPSGHVAAAAVVAGGLAALLTRRRFSILPVGVLAAVVIGVSRLVLDMHSLPEVIVGAGVGLAGATALMSMAGPPPTLKPGKLIALVVIVVAVFHGLHLPAEAAIRHAAFHAAHVLEVCQQPG